MLYYFQMKFLLKKYYIFIIVAVLFCAGFAAAAVKQHIRAGNLKENAFSAQEQDRQIEEFQAKYEQKLTAKDESQIQASSIAKDENPPYRRIYFKPGGIPVLMYHYVGSLPPNADAIRKDLTVSAENFSAQMDYLAQSGYRTITTARLYNYLSGKSNLPPKPIVITLDDGHADAFKNAVPILLAHHMVASFAVVSGFVGTSDYATWQQISRAQSEGMEIINHSFNHMNFADPRFTLQYKQDAIAKCVSALQGELGDNTKTFVYPYGSYGTDIENLLKADGFDMAFTTNFGEAYKGDNLFELPRIRVHGLETLERFRETLGDYGNSKLASR